MAQMSGYICDVCEKFTLKMDAWMQLSGGPNTSGKIDICSNKCLVKIARQRLEAEKEMQATDPTNGNKAPYNRNTKFTDDQKLEIVAEAMEHGVKATAEAHGLHWQAVARWKSEFTK